MHAWIKNQPDLPPPSLQSPNPSALYIGHLSGSEEDVVSIRAVLSAHPMFLSGWLPLLISWWPAQPASLPCPQANPGACTAGSHGAQLPL